jgi:spore coat polysaccharide biosynthesis protein SpsF (cytidylyltransferase family)
MGYMGKVVCIVQARTTSERFPCKIFAALHGKPMLAHVLERAAAIHGVDQVVLAVPENDVRLVAHLWPHVCGGSEKDVLGRYAKCAEQYEADVVIRLTGDNPLLCPDLSEKVLQYFHCQAFDYVSNVYPVPTWPDGTDTEVFTIASLHHAHREAKSAYDREHVTAWIRSNMNCGYYASNVDWSQIRWTVDTRNDIVHVENVLYAAHEKKWTLSDLIEAEAIVRDATKTETD